MLFTLITFYGALSDRRILAKPAALTEDDFQLRTQLDVLRALLDQSPVAMLSAQPDGGLRALNRAARSLFQAEDFVVGRRDLQEAIFHVRPGERLPIAIQVPGASLSRTYSMSVADVRTVRGPTRVVVLADVQGEVLAAEAAALRSVLQVLGHEIMNSLTPVISLVQSAEEILSEGPKPMIPLARKALATAHRRAEGLHHFISSYRELARLPDLQRTRQDVIELICEASQLFRARWQEQVKLEVVAPSSGAVFALDRELLLTAVLNLMANAAEAALEGSPSPWVRIEGRVDEAWLEIQVEDNGPGVPDEIQSRIFDPFFTSKDGGTGIGLSLTRQIVAMHGGVVSYSPRDGGGSSFRIQI
jgi:signal transduction histidine kinase